MEQNTVIDIVYLHAIETNYASDNIYFNKCIYIITLYKCIQYKKCYTANNLYVELFDSFCIFMKFHSRYMYIYIIFIIYKIKQILFFVNVCQYLIKVIELSEIDKIKSNP